MHALLLLLAVPALISAQECIALDDADGLQKFVGEFDLAKVAAGTLGSLCCGDSGKLSLAPIQLADVIQSQAATVYADATYESDSKTLNLVCATDKATLLGLATAALSGKQPSADVLAKFSLKCRDKANPTHVVFQFDASDLTSAKCSPDEDAPVPVATTAEPRTTGKTVTGVPRTTAAELPPPPQTNCDDLNALKANPLKFLLGVTVCVGDAGRFVVDPVDVAQIAALSEGNPLTLKGAFKPHGDNKKDFRVSCELGAEFAQKLLPLAQNIAANKFDVDIAAFKDIVDLRCSDGANQHLVTINKDNISGASFEDLQQKFELSGVNVQTFQQAYMQHGDDLEIGQFSLKDGKLTYPGGTVDVTDGIDFVTDQVAVIKDDDKVQSVVTQRGVVSLKDGTLTLKTKAGKEFTIASGCDAGRVLGGTLITKCDGKFIAVRPGSLTNIDGQPNDPETMKFEKTSGYLQIPEFCRTDQKCRLHIEEAMMKSAEARGCKVSFTYNEEDSKKDRGIYNLVCPSVQDPDAAALLIDEIALGVNGDAPESERIVSVPLEDVEGDLAMMMKASVAALKPAFAALFLIVAMIL